MVCKRQKTTHSNLKSFINSSVCSLFIHLKVTKLERQGDSRLPSLLDPEWKRGRGGSLSPPLASGSLSQDGCPSSSCRSLPRGSREPAGGPDPVSHQSSSVLGIGNQTCEFQFWGKRNSIIPSYSRFFMFQMRRKRKEKKWSF